MRYLAVLLGLLLLVLVPRSADSYSCGKVCKPAITRCAAVMKRKRCKRLLVKDCRQAGSVACDFAYLPTTTTTSTSSTSTTLPRIAVLLGRWAFTYTIISTFTDEYSLTRIDHLASGAPVLIGVESGTGDVVAAGRYLDVVGTQTSYEFSLVDPGLILCEAYSFDRTCSP